MNSFAKTYDVYEPKKTGADKAPVLLFVHGGAWQGDSKANYSNLGQNFAKLGVCVVAIEYRLSSVAPHPAPVEDLNKAIQDLSTEKSSHCDFSKVFLVGHSAGAHMIAFWNSKYTSDRVKGFVGIEGIYDIPNLIQVWPGYKSWFIEKEFGAEKNWAAASPTRLKMKSKAPWLVVHSKKDELVDLKQSQDFLDSLKKQELKAELLLLEKQNHFDPIQDLALPDSTITKKLLQFMK